MTGLKTALMLGGLMISGAAHGMDLYAVATMNPFTDKIENKDYGSVHGTGGNTLAVGVSRSESLLMGWPQLLAIQQVSQHTAWNTYQGTGGRDGYKLRAMELLTGYRWWLSSKVKLSLLFGAGKSKIDYESRNSAPNSDAIESTRSVFHLTTQGEIRYVLPLGLETTEIALTGVLRASKLQSHGTAGNVSSADWYINLPTAPVPSLGISVAF